MDGGGGGGGDGGGRGRGREKAKEKERERKREREKEREIEGEREGGGGEREGGAHALGHHATPTRCSCYTPSQSVNLAFMWAAGMREGDGTCSRARHKFMSS